MVTRDSSIRDDTTLNRDLLFVGRIHLALLQVLRRLKFKDHTKHYLVVLQLNAYQCRLHPSVFKMKHSRILHRSSSCFVIIASWRTTGINSIYLCSKKMTDESVMQHYSMTISVRRRVGSWSSVGRNEITYGWQKDITMWLKENTEREHLLSVTLMEGTITPSERTSRYSRSISCILTN